MEPLPFFTVPFCLCLLCPRISMATPWSLSLSLQSASQQQLGLVRKHRHLRGPAHVSQQIMGSLVDLRHCLSAYRKGNSRCDHRMSLEPTELFCMPIKVEAKTAWGGTMYALLSRNRSWQPVSLPLRDCNVFPHLSPVKDRGSKAEADPVV